MNVTSIEATKEQGDAAEGFAVLQIVSKGLSENTSNELKNIRKIISTLVENFKECRNVLNWS